MHKEFEKTESNEIRVVKKFLYDSGAFLLKCPHCDNIRSIDNEFGSIDKLAREQYQDNLCNGWYEVDPSPILVDDIEKL